MSPSLERITSISSIGADAVSAFDTTRSVRPQQHEKLSTRSSSSSRPAAAGAAGESPFETTTPPSATETSSASKSSSSSSSSDDGIPGMGRQDSSMSITSSASSDSPQTGMVDVAVVNVKYHNPAGRNAVLSRSLSLHHDFGCLTSILNVTLAEKDLDDLAAHPDVAWVDRSGAVHFIQPAAMGLR